MKISRQASDVSRRFHQSNSFVKPSCPWCETAFQFRSSLPLRALCVLLLLLSVTLFVAAAGDGHWLTAVPEKARVRPNPMSSDPDAVRAGAKLFRQHCASCHGDDAQGKGRKPPLRSDHLRQATPGELEWLLNNGSLRNGMPSWSRLPEPQRWQLVAYIKSLR